MKTKTIFRWHNYKPLFPCYQLAEKPPSIIYKCLEKVILAETNKQILIKQNHQYSILLENLDALLSAKKNLESAGFAVEIDASLVEQEIGE